MVIIVEATHKHVVTLNKDGIQITDGVNGNKIIMGQKRNSAWQQWRERAVRVGQEIRGECKGIHQRTAGPHSYEYGARIADECAPTSSACVSSDAGGAVVGQT